MRYKSDEYRAWNWRYYVRNDPDAKRSALVLHGDIFDWLEDLPAGPRAALVSWFGPQARAGRSYLGSPVSFLTEQTREWHAKQSYRDSIQGVAPAHLGMTDGVLKSAEPRVNVQTVKSGIPEGLKYLDSVSCNRSGPGGREPR